MNVCKNLCERYRKVNYTKTGYNTKKIAFCRNCNHMFHREDIVKNRCPCCVGAVRMNVRSSRRREMLKLRVKRY